MIFDSFLFASNGTVCIFPIKLHQLHTNANNSRVFNQDYDDLQDLRPQRGQPGQLRESADREPQRETTTPVPILKQINE